MSDFQTLSIHQCDDSEYKPINEIKSYKGSNEVFEKNYAKNILISMLDFLVLNGYKYLLQRLPFNRKQIQKKNSASLDDIFDSLELLKMNDIDKKHCLKCCCNLILKNSKVSKKRFHLQILNVMLSFSDDVQRGQFKVLMSQQSRLISKKKSQNIQMFNYQSSTIYLLNVFLGLFTKYQYLNEDNFRYRWRTLQQISDQQIKINSCSTPYKVKNKNKTRQLLKPLANQLKQTLNREPYNQTKFQIISIYIKYFIAQTEKKIKETLFLTHGIPNLINFYTKVVQKCFQCLERKQKITAKILRQFIKQFQNATFQFTQGSIFNFNVIKQNQQNQSLFKNSNTIEKQHNDFQSQPSIFCPYLIVAPP